MRCAACGEETASRPCAACGADPLLSGRYELGERLGSGASGTVYRGTDTHTGDAVALKEIPFRMGDDAKVRELVARESSVLRQLSHPGIPRWRDELEAGRGRGRVLFLVQDLIEGRSLADELAERRWSEDEVLALLEDVLPILVYLHERHPPVIHRDIKPGNLVRRPDGRLALVDFGAVQDALASARLLGGSTVAGTFGYMAPEQFRGHAEPATDLYALGMTAVALLSRQDPAVLHDRAGNLRWREAVSLGAGTTALLADLLAPDPADRPANAQQVLARVGALRAGTWGGPAPAAQPSLTPTPTPTPTPPPLGAVTEPRPRPRLELEPFFEPLTVRSPMWLTLRPHERNGLAILAAIGVNVLLYSAMAAFMPERSAAAPPPPVSAPVERPVPVERPAKPHMQHHFLDLSGRAEALPEKVQKCTGLPGEPVHQNTPSQITNLKTLSSVTGWDDHHIPSWPMTLPLDAPASTCFVKATFDQAGLASEVLLGMTDACPDNVRKALCEYGPDWRPEHADSAASGPFSLQFKVTTVRVAVPPR